MEGQKSGSFLSPDGSGRAGHPGNGWSSTECGGGDVTTCVRAEGWLERDSGNGERNVTGRIKAEKMLSWRDSLS